MSAISGRFLCADIELFQDEVESSLAEPWHRKDYGLLKKDAKSDYCTTKARADHLRVEFKPTVPAEPEEAPLRERFAEPVVPKPSSLMEGREADLASIAISLRRLRWQVPVATILIVLAILLT